MEEREGAADTRLEVEIVAAESTADAEAERLVGMALAPPARIEGIVVGVLAGLGAGGEPFVDFTPNPRAEPLPARSTVVLDGEAVGRDVALLFEGGDPARPIVIGLLHRPGPASIPTRTVEVEADGERVVVEAQRELVLRCGKASITLTSAGKVLIRGAYVLNRSSGVNRIQGGSVQIN